MEIKRQQVEIQSEKKTLQSLQNKFLDKLAACFRKSIQLFQFVAGGRNKK